MAIALLAIACLCLARYRYLFRISHGIRTSRDPDKRQLEYAYELETAEGVWMIVGIAFAFMAWSVLFDWIRIAMEVT